MVRPAFTAPDVARLVAVTAPALQAPAARQDPVLVPGYPASAGPPVPGELRGTT